MNTQTIQVREMTPEDLPALANFPGPFADEKNLTDLTQPGVVVWIAWLGDRIGGVAIAERADMAIRGEEPDTVAIFKETDPDLQWWEFVWLSVAPNLTEETFKQITEGLIGALTRSCKQIYVRPNSLEPEFDISLRRAGFRPTDTTGTAPPPGRHEASRLYWIAGAQRLWPVEK